MFKKAIYFALLSMLIVGCGEPIEEIQKEDKSKLSSNYTPSANNQQSATNKDSTLLPGNNSTQTLGYIGSDVRFGENRVVDNYWALYLVTDTKDSYNTYLYGYKFYPDGSLLKRDASIEYKVYLKNWGVDAKGSILTISPDEKYTIISRFTTDKNCYLVSTTLISSAKLCNEVPINSGYPKNEIGFYGNGVKFGNYIYANVDVVGKWEFNQVNSASQNTQIFILNSDGTATSNSFSDTKKWGVSDDGKVLSIGDNKFLVYKYFAQNCFWLSKIEANSIVSQYQACKK